MKVHTPNHVTLKLTRPSKFMKSTSQNRCNILKSDCFLSTPPTRIVSMTFFINNSSSKNFEALIDA
ncbi:hypothetical protein X975_03751, partial [Stegodyphus mimosarum]